MTAKPSEYYAPRWPTLTALAWLSLWILILSLPMWSGQFLAGPYSDQYTTGYAIRLWGAQQWRLTGHAPLWNPMLRSGVPVVAGFGDLFYPTSWLRLLFPTVAVWDGSFVVHYILAGLFVYLFLRMMDLSWLGSVVGGLAYQLSGVIVSYPSPGHDGKLYVTALFPLMLIGLVLGIRRRRLEGFALFGLAVALALLSPQYQTTQYALIASGIFTLYLAFADPQGLRPAESWRAVALAVVAVVLGFGIAAIQFYPFLHYIPFSPRSGTGGYEWSTSYAMPWTNVPEWFFSGFAGYGFAGGDTYWGPNGLKLHSQYLGLAVLALAVFGIRGERPRLAKWLGAIGILFVLVALGSGTPFYHLWYALVPYVKKTRAPDIAMYVAAFVVACFAGFGAERLERGEGRRWFAGAAIAGVVLALLALAGTFGAMALSWAQAHQTELGAGIVQSAQAAQNPIRWGAVGSAAALALVAALAWLYLAGKVTRPVLAGGLLFLVGGDLWRAGRPFWQWSRPAAQQAAADDVTRYLNAVKPPYRVLMCGPYNGDALMAHSIPDALGYHGFDLAAYDGLVGGSASDCRANPNILHLQLWNLLAIRYLVVADSAGLPAGLHRVLGPVTTGLGAPAYLYEIANPGPYARVVPAGVKADTDQIVPTLLDPRMDYDKFVIFDPGQPVNPLPVTNIADITKSPSRATVTAWQPGRMTVALDPAPPQDSYLLVAENWYKDWHARVDGDTATVLRGDQSLIVVPVRAGSRQVELWFAAADYERGKHVTEASAVLLLLLAAVPLARRRRRG